MIRIPAKIKRIATLVRIGCPCIVTILTVLTLIGAATAVEQKKSNKSDVDTQPVISKQAVQNDAQQYCNNIAGAAIDARYTWQTKKLTELEDQIKSRISELEQKQEEYKEWIKHREDLEKKAEENLVGIYAHMRPEVAATQLAALDDDMAAAVLTQLNPRIASAILNEFQPEHAARLANVMAGHPAPAPDGKKL